MPPTPTPTPTPAKRRAPVNPAKAAEARRKRRLRADKQKEADKPTYPPITRFSDDHLIYLFDQLKLVKCRQTHGKNWRIEDLRDIALRMRERFKIHFTAESLKGKWTTLKQEWAIWIKHLSHISGYNAPPGSAPSACADAEEAHLQHWPECHHYMDGAEPQWKSQLEELVGEEVATGYEAATAADLVEDSPAKEEEEAANSSESDSNNSDSTNLSQLSEWTRGIRIAKRNENNRKRAKAKAQKGNAEKRIHRKNDDRQSLSTARAAMEPLHATLAEFMKTQEVRAALPPARIKTDVEILSDRLLDPAFLTDIPFAHKVAVMESIAPVPWKVSMALALIPSDREAELEEYVRTSLSNLHTGTAQGLNRPSTVPHGQLPLYGYQAYSHLHGMLPSGGRHDV